MTDAKPEMEQSIVRWYWRRPLLALLGTISIGAVGSGLWDVGVKPSASWLGRIATTMFTLGSDTIRDNAYASAALDQTPVAAHVVLFIAVGSLFGTILSIILKEFWNPQISSFMGIKKTLPEPNDNETRTERLEGIESIGETIDSTRQRIGGRRRILVVVLTLMAGFLGAQALVFNQSLLIWRSFHTDIRMCAPFFTDAEEEMIYSQFAAMQSKADYGKILDMLRPIAESEDLELHSNELW